jgi:hypothetical protein
MGGQLEGCLGLKTLFSTIIVVKNDRYAELADLRPKDELLLNQPTVKKAIMSHSQ